MRRVVLFLIAMLAGPVILVAAARAQTSYEACVAEVERDADAAYDRADAWRRAGGGVPALHCAALALSRLGLHADAAKRLDLAAQSSPGTPEQADLYLQAGHAWLLADDPAAAMQSISAGLAANPDAPTLLSARGQLFVMRGDWASARSDLDRSLAADPGQADAHVLRAAARRNLGDLAGAEADIAAALDLSPHSDTALLERGLLNFTKGDRQAAEQDWMSVIDNPQSSGAARHAAEDYLLRATDESSNSGTSAP